MIEDRHQVSPTELDGAIAPPRKNGELAFEAPWESRAFGIAMTLHGRGMYGWEEFSRQLAAQIAAAGSSSPGEPVLPVASDAEGSYYEHWLSSLETLLVEKGVVTREQLEARITELAAGEQDHEH